MVPHSNASTCSWCRLPGSGRDSVLSGASGERRHERLPAPSNRAVQRSHASYEQIIGGRYALHGPIASGGMATVHFGRQLGAAGFARTVAIKRLRGEFLESHEFISTLLDEARLASRIRHPNVVATLDMVAADDELFLVMDYVAGESLSRLLSKLERRGERVPPQVATGILCGVLHALHAAHEATDERGEPLGIVHRDVSPQNVLVGEDGLARLLDFGIAKGKGRLQTTRAGQLKGKVGYMAPEQILGEEPDRRSDVYAAAVVLWEVLTGRRLFPTSDRRADSFNLIPKILEADVDPPSAVAAVPSALDAIVMRGLNRQRDARYDTAREFAVALEDTVGVATSRQIGEWVERVVGDELRARAAEVQRLEAQALEAEVQRASGRSAEQLADATVLRRRRKRLASSGDHAAESEAGSVADPPTEVEDEESEDTVERPRAPLPQAELDDDDDEDLKATRVGFARAAARAKAEAERRQARPLAEAERRRAPPPTDAEALRRTTRWRRGDDDEEAEAATGVYRAAARGAPAKDATATESLDDGGTVEGELSTDEDGSTEDTSGALEEEATVHANVPRPSDFRAGASRSGGLHKGAPRRGEHAERGGDGDEALVVPVRSQRWLVVVLVVAAAIAALLAAVKMLRAS